MKFIYKYMYSHDIPYMYTCTVYVHVNVKFIKNKHVDTCSTCNY